MVKTIIRKLFNLPGHDNVGVADQLEIRQIRNGRVIRHIKTKWGHTPTEVGFAEIANLAGNVTSPVAFTYLEVGTGTTAENPAHTTLVTPVTDTGLARAAATCTRVQTTVANDTLQLYKDWTATGVKILREIGAFNANAAGIMLGRKLFDAITTANGDHFQATYKFKFSA